VAKALSPSYIPVISFVFPRVYRSLLFSALRAAHAPEGWKEMIPFEADKEYANAEL
jgi:hypothetical protein